MSVAPRAAAHEHAAANMETFDVAIVGAGPAGATAAWALARTGRRVVLLEKARLPRYKTCGGGVLTRARAWLPPLDAGVFECVDARASLHLLRSDGTSLDCASDEPIPVALAMRARLDHALADAAVRAGAELRDTHEVLAVEDAPAHVELATNRGRLRADFLVVADGATGPTARLAGWSAPHGGVAALEWELDVDAATLARFSARARFDFGDVDCGYAWVFGKRKRLSVGILSTRRSGGLAPSLERYLERLAIRPTRVERHGYVIPLAPRRDGVARGRVLLVGDAAGLADPVLAEGISHAALSARLAARALDEGRGRVDDCARRYRELVDAEIGRELVWARRLARLLHRPPLRAWLFERFGDPFVTAMGSVASGRHGYRQLLFDPRHYWRLIHGSSVTREKARRSP